MLRCVQNSARRLRHPVPIHSSDADTTFCHNRPGPRSASTAAQAQDAFDDAPLSGPGSRALDLSALPREGDVLRKMYSRDVNVRWVTDQTYDQPSNRDRSLQEMIDRRIGRLPRALLENRSAKESDIFQSASTTPSYLTARKDVENILPKALESRSRSKTAFRERYKPGRVNWLPYARRLVDIESKQDELFTTSVEVSNTFLQSYTGSERPNMWIQRTGSGSEVRVLSTQAEGTAEGLRRMLLQGSLRAVELAKGDILKLQHDHEENDQLSPDPPRLIEAAEDDYLTVASIASFTRYVFRVTNENVPRHREQRTGRPWHQVAAEELVAVFTTPATSIYASTVALNRALTFLRTRTELLGTATVIYNRAKQMGLHMDCTSYNLLLAPALWSNDTERVRQLLSDMKTTGTVPNSHTWSIFFRACRHPSERAVMIELMTEADVRLTPQAKAAMSTSLIRRNFYWMSDSSDEVHLLVSLLDKTFGPEWVNAQSYSLMVNMCHRRNLRRQVLPVLESLAEDRLVLKQSSAAEAIFKTQSHKSMFDGVEWLISLRSQTDRATRKRMISDMFMRAWDTKHANICRVLWHYAATHGWLTWHMRSAVNEALLRNTTEQKNSNARRASRLMARIVIGLDLNTEGFHESFPLLSKRFEGIANPMLWLSEYTPDDGTRDEQLSLAYAVMGRDLSAHEKYAPMSKSMRNSLLRAAVVKDATWIRRRWWDAQTPSDLVEKSIRIPLQEHKEFRHSIEMHAAATAVSNDAFPRKRGYSAVAFAHPRSRVNVRRLRSGRSNDFLETNRLMAQIGWLREQRTPSIKIRKLVVDEGGPEQTAKAKTPTPRQRRIQRAKRRSSVTISKSRAGSHAPKILGRMSHAQPDRRNTNASRLITPTSQSRRVSTLRTIGIHNDAHVIRESEIKPPMESYLTASSKPENKPKVVFRRTRYDAPVKFRKMEDDQQASEKSGESTQANVNQRTLDLQTKRIKPGNSFRKLNTDGTNTIIGYHSPPITVTEYQAQARASLPMMGKKERLIITRYKTAVVSRNKPDRDIIQQYMKALRFSKKKKKSENWPAIQLYQSGPSTPVRGQSATTASDANSDPNDQADQDAYIEWQPSDADARQVGLDADEGAASNKQENKDWRDVMVDLVGKSTMKESESARRARKKAVEGRMQAL